MRHRKAGKQLGRNTSHRRAMLRNMVTSLFEQEQIVTTDAKAKAMRPLAEKMITLAKRGDLHARRQALAYMQDKGVVHKLFGDLKDRYLDRQGGYLRIVKKGFRRGDGAAVSVIQLLPSDEEMKSRKKKAKRSDTEKRGEEKD
ncbi:MAG: 50S ribosomal protein L17 [Deltaproteobacteria bacterium]|nr:50S ribosomal protein L17 [Deltaproteobacteria bacterium]MBW2048067.1 50S ribosomal protein L17 [Deltaproteobacteria bacterium]MBW2352614.1 50S ribosomal protein L17 [Deltaproteobacteria bacterium]HDZ90105.1 50S ribosomal protein L17 [Deltaproteobacteria bacterium]